MPNDKIHLASSLDRQLAQTIYSERQSKNSALRSSQDSDESLYFIEIVHDVCRQLLRLLGANRYRFFCSGYEPGAFVQLGRTGPLPQTAIPTNDTAHPVIKQLHRMSPKLFLDYNNAPRLVEPMCKGKGVVVWLFARGEFFGFIDFQSSEELDSGALAALSESIHVVLNFLAEEYFAFRVGRLTAPIANQDLASPPKLSNEESVKLLSSCFGADGSILRLLDHNGELVVDSRAGLANSSIVASRPSGQLASGKLIDSDEHDWLAVVFDDPDYSFGGFELPPEDRHALRSTGMHSLIMAKLSSKGGATGAMGTLSYYFMRPHYFSRRDIVLFRAFCRRVADRLALQRAFEELHGNAAILEAQSKRITFVEVANLLAHDLWHKSQSNLFAANKLSSSLRTQINSHELKGTRAALEALLTRADHLTASATSLFQTHNTLRSIQKINPDSSFEIEDFSVAEVFNQVSTTLAPALATQKISVDSSISPSIKIRGPKIMFEQVVFNLFINTIDAARGRTSIKPMKIDISAHVRGGRVVLRFQDEGPGIDVRNFPNEQDVFEIGRTSKKDGTGTGLPMARQLIGSHFQGNLVLQGRRPPLFTIDVPVL